ncbi:MAG: leucine-rich repeat domain-containing protein [Prevotella sp.]|nr:leucine-rich repeat domain-containing protein [Prevotella sp.]
MKKVLLSFALALVATVNYAQKTPATDESDAMERKDVPTTEVNGLWWVFNESDKTAYFAYRCNRRDVMDTEWLRDNNPGAYSGDIVIPETVNGYTVAGIWEFAFDGCQNLKSVTLPSTIKTIGAYAFWQCSITEITIPSSVEVIGDYGLSGNKLKKVIIEDGTKTLKLGYGSSAGVAPNIGTPMFGDLGGQEIEEAYIGRRIESQWPDLFHGNQTLKKLTLNDNVLSVPDSYCENCTNLETVVLGKNINSIGNAAFWGCLKLTSINLPQGIVSIGNNAFNSCESLTKIHFPTTLKTIGEYAFGQTALTELTIPASVDEIGEAALVIQTLKKVTIEDGETTLNMGRNNWAPMFGEGNVIEEAYIGRNIESDLFHGNQTLKKITFGDKVTSIYTSYCEGCPLETLILGTSVSRIGESAFSAFWEESAKLSVIYSYAMTPPVCVDDNVFNNINKQTCKLYVPAGTVNTYKAAPTWKDFFNIESLAETKCAAPTITLENGKLKFASTTKGVEFHYNVTVSGSKEGIGSEIEVPSKYNVSVYATKAGLEDSDVTTTEITVVSGSNLAGDANCDGVINTADIVTIVNTIFSR